MLRDVVKMLRNPSKNALVLYGQRRIGKTSVLLELQRELTARATHTPIYFDLQDKAALPLKQVLYQLAQTIAQALGLLATNFCAGPSPRGTFDCEGLWEGLGKATV